MLPRQANDSPPIITPTPSSTSTPSSRAESDNVSGSAPDGSSSSGSGNSSSSVNNEPTRPSSSSTPPQSSSNPPPPSSSSSSSPQPSSSSSSSSSSTTSAPSGTVTSKPTPNQPGETTISVLGFPTASEAFMLSTITTQIDGQTTVIVSPVPTGLSADNAARASRNRTIAIAASTTGAVVLLSLILAGIFLYRRHQNRELGFIEGLLKRRREGKGAGSVGLLDGEFEDDDLAMQRYRDTPTGYSTTSPSPSLFRARASDTGSIFREAVWPPPGEESRFIDPLKTDLDFTHIVDDVMGPSPNHERDTSASSTTPLISAAAPPAGVPRAPNEAHLSVGTIGSLYNDPFRETSQTSASSPSVYYYRPDSQLSLSNDTASPINQVQYPTSLLGLPAGAAQPKKPSPLVNNVVSAPSLVSPSASELYRAENPSSRTNGDSAPKNWLERSPKRPLRDLRSPLPPP